MENIDLKEHQERAGQRLKDPNIPGLLLYWSLGSGKTIGAINAAKTLKTKATVVVPASLQENFKKEVNKIDEDLNNFSVQSYERFTKKPDLTNNGLLVLDEAHKLRTSNSKRSRALQQASQHFNKRLLLTGTPIQNSPAEIAPLINTITGTNTLPTDTKEFNKRYIHKELIVPSIWDRFINKKSIQTKVSINNERDFRKRIHGLIDYYDAKNPVDYPEITEHTIEVPMSSKQVALYDFYERKLPKSLRIKINNMLPPTKQEAKQLNSFLSATRQASNTSSGFFKENEEPSLKIKVIADYIQKDFRPAVVYSNYLESGLNPLSSELKKRNIPHGVFTGSLSSEQKNELVKAYNSKKIKALLISSSGGEGLDLKHTGSVHIMEPHWNEPKIDQVIGRAARYHSHYDLPEGERNVHVFKYLSKFENPRKGLLFTKPRISADQYLTNLSKQKAAINGMFLKILKEEGKGHTKTALLEPLTNIVKRQKENENKFTEETTKVGKFFKLGAVAEILDNMGKAMKNPEFWTAAKKEFIGPGLVLGAAADMAVMGSTGGMKDKNGNFSGANVAKGLAVGAATAGVTGLGQALWREGKNLKV
jgi:superfamily II DNA or RNA helicase